MLQAHCRAGSTTEVNKLPALALPSHSLSLCGLPDVDGASVSCSTAGQLTRSL
jgi:hypothetical protein